MAAESLFLTEASQEVRHRGGIEKLVNFQNQAPRAYLPIRSHHETGTYQTNSLIQT